MFRTPTTRREAAELAIAAKLSHDPHVGAAAEDAIQEWRDAGEPLSTDERAAAEAAWGSGDPEYLDVGQEPEIAYRAPRA